MTDRNAEIWSSRVQRELLALTTSSDADVHVHRVEGEPTSTTAIMAVLPPFITLNHHELDIAQGVCRVSFAIHVQDTSTTTTKTSTTSDASPTEHQPSLEGADKEESNAGQVETNSESLSSSPSNEADIVVTLDATLPRNADGSINTSGSVYPFQPPRAMLLSGSNRFPGGSTIQNGNYVDIDCDWTPSLHLTDAAINIGLKIKESILQKEPFHPATLAMEATHTADPVEEIVQSARRFGTNLGRSIRSSLKIPVVAVASSDDHRAPTATSHQPHSLQPQPLVPPRAKRTPGRKPPQKQTPKKAINPADIKIGDEINFLDSQWVECRGMYSCKAIRRPEFVQDAMEHAAQAEKEVATVGFAGAGAMFRSFTQTARSVLEESSLMITDTHIIELKSSRLNLSVGTVTFCIDIDLLAKLKFRRQESISLFFKPAPDDPLIYMCPDSGDAVYQIQAVLKQHGVKGKHTNASMQRAINEALQIVQQIQTKELALKHDPNMERVNEIMDLYRQAAERFEVAGDPRHEEVVVHMRRFLALPLTASILDGTFQPAAAAGTTSRSSNGLAIPQGEVLERTHVHLDEDDDVDEHESKEKEKREDEVFQENMDNLMKEAKQDLENLNLEQGWNNDGVDDEDLDAILASGGASGTTGDTIEDLDAMLNAADKELADLMKA